MEPQDFLLDENNDMFIDPSTGDWAFGPTNEIDAMLILNSQPGTWRQSPTCGVGMPNYLNADLSKTDMTKLEQLIQAQLKQDGFTGPDATLLLNNQTLLGVQVKGDRQV